QKSGLADMPWAYVQVGNVAQILEGPLRGLTGIIIKIKSGVKLVLSVSLLQRSVAVEVEREWVGDARAGRPSEVGALHYRQAALPSEVVHLSAMKGISDETLQADSAARESAAATILAEAPMMTSDRTVCRSC